MKIIYVTFRSVKIRNSKGTSERNCKCGSWINHWQKLTKNTVYKCSIHGCEELAVDGAHITRPIAKKKEYRTHDYIVPMCKSHNLMHGKEFYVKVGTKFVWANKSETCESV